MYGIKEALNQSTCADWPANFSARQGAKTREYLAYFKASKLRRTEHSPPIRAQGFVQRFLKGLGRRALCLLLAAGLPFGLLTSTAAVNGGLDESEQAAAYEEPPAVEDGGRSDGQESGALDAPEEAGAEGQQESGSDGQEADIPGEREDAFSNLPESRFSDVDDGDWFYPFVALLSAQEVISGYPDGTFRPQNDVTVGETLALVMLAAGHEVEYTGREGVHWSQDFADFAVGRSYLARSITAELDVPMTRLQVGQLAARALKLVPPKGGKTPFVDADDGYLTALYQKGVLSGSMEGGVLVYKPDDPISRAEISAIIWNIRSKDVHTGQIETEYYYVDVLEGIPVSAYDPDAFRLGEDGLMRYTGPGVRTKNGVDVASFQGEIDWERVKAAGIDFAIIRVGGRGYTEGKPYDDSYFERNIQGALAAGVEVGAYYFSQAVSVEEAREEAAYTLEKLAPYRERITFPVVFDWEDNSSSYRTYRMDSDLLGACANAFCELVSREGYDAMIYFNRYGGYRSYDLRQVREHKFWFAQYLETSDHPTFYYDFDMWQYSSNGRVDGINGDVDLDIFFLKEPY